MILFFLIFKPEYLVFFFLLTPTESKSVFLKFKLKFKIFILKKVSPLQR